MVLNPHLFSAYIFAASLRFGSNHSLGIVWPHVVSGTLVLLSALPQVGLWIRLVSSNSYTGGSGELYIHTEIILQSQWQNLNVGCLNGRRKE